MSANGMNYSMYNTIGYAQTAQQQQQPYYGQAFQNALSQQTMPPYGAYPMYPSPPVSNPPQYNSYDHIIRSTAETLVAYNHSTDSSTMHNPPTHLHRTTAQQTLNRRSNKTSFSSNNSPRMYYCETCRIACGGLATYQAHLNGSKHKKKELVAQNQQAPVNLSSKAGVNILRCELCDITCTSSDAYKAHLEGSKHEKATKLHRKLGKAIPSVEPQILNNISTSSQVNSTIPSSTNESQTSTNEDQQVSLSRLLENNIKPIGEEYIETTYDSMNKPILYHCKLCECKFNDIKGKEMHLKGKRHRLAYKKKVNPNFIVDSNSSTKSTNSKSKPINDTHSTIEYKVVQPSANTNNQSDRDDDTICLMTLHQQIVPTPSLLNTIEQFVGATESALKSCSERLQSQSTESVDENSSTTKTNGNQSPLIGVSRVGLLGKSLILKTDHLFHIVVICSEWPTKQLFQKILTILLDNFDDAWQDRLQIQYHADTETIELRTNTDEGHLGISIAFTSYSIQQQSESENKSQELLSKTNCLNALYAIQSTRWFQNQVSIRQYASALIRCFRYKTKISTYWASLSSEAIEILIDQSLTQSSSAVHAFRRVLEYLSGGLVLANGPGLSIPWQTNSTKNVFESLTNQERNDITFEAQMGLRLLSYGKLKKWFEPLNHHQSTVPYSKRFLTDSDDQIQVKRQCIKQERE